jgi:hypothetical protein
MRHLTLLIISFGCLGANAFAAIQKECTGGTNSSSVLGRDISVSITATALELKLTEVGYADAIGSYPLNAHSKVAGNDLEFVGDDPDHQNGYRFLVDPALLSPRTTGTIHVRLDSGIEGYIDADYTCRDF